VASGDWDYITSYTDRAQLTVIVANPGVNEAEINDCYVVGFSFSSKSGKYKDDFTIELANGIKLFESTESDIKTAYGAPEYRSENEYSDGSGTYVSIDYAGDDEKDGMDFDVTPEKNLISIRLINSKMPEGATSVADLSMDAPAINDQYVAPGGASADRFDGIITIGDKNYVLPVPFTELEKDGWTLDTSVSDYIGGKNYESTYMEKNGEKLSIKLENFTGNAILPKYGYISEIGVEADYYTSNITFPGGISMGDDGSKIESVYGDLGDDFSKDEYTYFISYYVYYYEGDHYISISAYADPDTGKITDYTFTMSKEIE
jgi:hypothetical protein